MAAHAAGRARSIWCARIWPRTQHLVRTHLAAHAAFGAYAARSILSNNGAAHNARFGAHKPTFLALIQWKIMYTEVGLVGEGIRSHFRLV